MFYCTRCPGSFFATREALATHCKTSSQWHPYCWKCNINLDDEKQFDRHMVDNHGHYNCFYCGLRFGSEGAMERHTRAKHSRYRCEVCDEGFETEIGRNRHYRNSYAHPSCSKCGYGCEDHELLKKHEDEAHPQLSCRPCGGQMFYVDEVETHYLESLNHPVCSYCLVGFEDRISYEKHIDSLHPELQSCPLTVPGDSRATPDYPAECPSDTQCRTLDGDSNDSKCAHDLVDEDEDEVRLTSLRGIISSTEITGRSDEIRLSDSDDDSSTDLELQWTPTLSDYESATDEDDSEQRLEFSEYRLHTNSPAWAALFPLPDSPEAVTVALSSKNPDSSPDPSRVNPTFLKSTCNNGQDISDSPQMLFSQECGAMTVQPGTSYPALPCSEAIGIHTDDSYSPTDTVGATRTSSRDSSSGKASPFYSPSPGSPRSEELPELPSSPSSLLSSEWSYPDSPKTSEGSSHHRQYLPLYTSRVLPEAPDVACSGAQLAFAHSPQEENIPFEFSDSLFEEKFLEDRAEADAICGGNDKAGFVSETMTYGQSRTMESLSPKTPILPRHTTFKPLQPLHCRLCLRESCDDLTATMCGHIFCNSCITQAVIANPRCPVCEAPTLLYCLFRIDLSI